MNATIPQTINSVSTSGRLGADPEIKYVEVEGEGKAVATFSLAVYRSADASDWYQVQAWGKLAQIIADKLTKGMKVSIQAKLKIDSYEKDGEACFKPVLVASAVNF